VSRKLDCPGCDKPIEFPTGFPAKVGFFLCICPHCDARVKVTMRSFWRWRWPRAKQVKQAKLRAAQ
jgi:hypothetical protein